MSTTWTHPAAALIPAETLARVDEAISLHSDTYKEHNGFRPRLGVVWEVVAKDPEGFIAWLNSEVEELYAREREREARKAREREAFALKVAALGLDPERFAYLAD